MLWRKCDKDRLKTGNQSETQHKDFEITSRTTKVESL